MTICRSKLLESAICATLFALSLEARTLMPYAANFPDLFRPRGCLRDRSSKGAKPAGLTEQPRDSNSC
jgi:hypothetical protein